MNLLKINDDFTKAMIGTFVSIIALSFVAMAFPIVAYAVAFLLFFLLVTTIINTGLSTYLLIREFNKMIEEFFKQYEQAHN